MAKGNQSKIDIEHAAENAVKLIADAVGKATGAIASAAAEASKLIASNALDASKLVASNAVEAVKVLSAKSADGSSDHDVLLDFRAETRVRMDGLDKGIKDIKDSTTSRIDRLETEKLNKADSYPLLYKVDVEKRLDQVTVQSAKNNDDIIRIMTWGTVGVLVLGIAEFLLNYLIR